ncbi:hypothetical protein H9P43_008348 [Blastocladiella emersonii ATCC 22665]|nr:hypothetical protein H9P43_008348 [Blastocladiella emersonii ATCC 22665]
MSSAPRPGKLVFKGSGDAGKKKKKSSKRDKADKDHKPSKRKRGAGSDDDDEDAGLPESGWTQATRIAHLTGPCVVLFPGTSTPSSLYNPTDSPHAVLRPVDLDDGVDPDTWRAADFEPTDVHQVFVLRKLTSSSAAAAKAAAAGEGEKGDGEEEEETTERWSIKSAEGRYLSADKHGVVSCATEAVGPAEEWLPIILPETNQVAFQSVWGGVLHVDHATDARAAWPMRCDGDATKLGFASSFVVKVQADVVRRALREAEKAAGTRRRIGDHVEGDEDDVDELELVKKYQVGADVQLDGETRARLAHAKKQGKLGEAMLEVRTKSKRDKYCW